MTDSPLWTPDEVRIVSSNLWRFMQQRQLKSFDDVLRFSIDEPEAFWTDVWSFGAVKAETRGERVLVTGHKMQEARFFPDARLNYAENLLRKSDDSDALVFRGEDPLHGAMLDLREIRLRPPGQGW